MEVTHYLMGVAGDTKCSCLLSTNKLCAISGGKTFNNRNV